MSPGDRLRRTNHFVPASYLAAFSSDTTTFGGLWAYRRSDPYNPLSLRPLNVARINDLYVRNDEEGNPTDEVERFLADSIERPFASIRNRLVYGHQVGLNSSLDALSDTERMTIARFIAFQQLRTPVEREATRWLGKLSSRFFARESAAAGSAIRRYFEHLAGRALTHSESELLRRAILALPAIESEPADWLPRTMRNADRLSQLAFNFTWRLIRLNGSVQLPTCDMPLVCARRGQRENELGGAWGEPGFEATLNLSPSHVLYLSAEIDDEQFLASEDFAWLIWRRTVAYASEWVYCRSPDVRISSILENSPKPYYFVEINGLAFRVGHSEDEIDQIVHSSATDRIGFRYGVARFNTG